MRLLMTPARNLTPSRQFLVALTALGLGGLPAVAWAEDPPAMPMMDHSAMHHAPAAMPMTGESMPAMDHSLNGVAMPAPPRPAMDRGTMPHAPAAMPAEEAPMPGMDHSAHGSPMPDHSAMRSDDGTTGERDPHAYSGGATLTTGPYVLEGAGAMHTADQMTSASLLVNRLERVDTRDASFSAWDLRASIGRDFDKLVLKSEGEYADGAVEHARTEALWSHAIANFWDAQLGWRHDGGAAPEQDWLAFGVSGLAPYWFELDTTGYVGEGGQTALRVEGEYELLITQRLILQPRIEVTAYGRRDAARGVASGPSDATAGLRLRYEFSRQFAPYVGVEGNWLLGGTAGLARADGEPTRSTRWVAGVRFWF